MPNIEIEQIEKQRMDTNFEGAIIDTGVKGADISDRIFFTQAAIDTIKNEIAENNIGETYFIRLATRSLGCLGMQYKIGFDIAIKDDDRVFELDGIKIVIESHSLFYFMGVTIDFVDDINGTGFIFHNPHTQPTCGCSH
ncbi:MAG TPA: iron-sulfur cluster assembly accessory protein [Candidatus Kapabacteria bacterium]|jgi:iron-sulfur cluster assembly protein|nr:iron-sulfur cluster assembly accessory protein [Candidatus Kapabacteria bacterium]HOV92605.1 iron-sulfur cluster assembly accessory protein [Candidatus Kapabacteria bacterium]